MDIRNIKSKEDLDDIVITLRNEGKLTPRMVIRLKCLDCCAYSQAEVRNCDMQSCPCWEYRLREKSEV